MELGSAAPRPITVLIADDSASLRTLVRITLKSQGWNVVEADTAEAALAHVRADPPDIAIIDVTFGETGPDGLAVCAELKADPATSSVPIVILTAHDDPAQRRRAEAAGANAFVGKPFGPLELTEALRELLPPRQDAPALGVFLLDARAVEPTALDNALTEQRASVQRGEQRRLGDVLLAQGAVTNVALDRALLEQMHARATRAAATRTRVLIVDDHLAVREGLKALIREEDDLEVVGEAPDVAEGIRLARRIQPDIIVLDNEMPARTGLEALRDFEAETPGARIVMFSFDGSVRDRALAGGAHAFVSKDAPMHEILASIRPKPSGPPPQPMTVTFPKLPTARQLRHAALVIGFALAAYVAVFLILEPTIGAAAAIFSAVAVVLIGGLLGPEAGIVGAALSVVLTYVLWAVTGHAIGEPVILLGQGAGAVMIVLLGLSAGALRIVGPRLDPHRRRVEAVAEAARMLAGLDRRELVSALLEGMLHVAHGEQAMLFTNAAGDARLVAAVPESDDLAIDRIVPLVRDAMRDVAVQAAEPLRDEQRPRPDLRAAVVIPIAVPGQDVRGALAVLRRERALAADEIGLIRPFAQYLWFVLRAGPIGPRTNGRSRIWERPT